MEVEKVIMIKWGAVIRGAENLKADFNIEIPFNNQIGIK